MSTNWRKELEDALSAEVFWDEGVEAARNACVAGAPLAAAAMTAAAWYDNPLNGGRAMLAAYARLARLELHWPAWRAALLPAVQPETGDPDWVPGFGFVNARAELAIITACQRLFSALHGPRLAFVLEHQRPLRELAGPLNVAGLCALTFLDAEVSPDEAERHFLLLRLGPALAAAQRAKRAGLTGFPFFEEGYSYEGEWPAPRTSEPCSEAELYELKKAVGLVD